MRRLSLKSYWNILALVAAFFASDIFGQTGICAVNSLPGVCVEALDGDTFYVANEAAYFGRQVSFCPEQIGEVATPAQILIMLDKSGSMALLDPLRDAWIAYQQFVDSIHANSPQSMVGLITYGSHTPGGSDYWVSVYRPLQVGIGPNLTTIKSWVYRDSIVGSTPWGPALDSAHKVFSELPPNENRQIVFLSDGEPTGAEPQAIYFSALDRIGKLLPPIHTIYFFSQASGGWDATRSWFLDSLAGLTGGTYTEAGSRTDLYSAFLDSILGRISFRAKLEDFYISNTNSEEYKKFESISTTGGTTLVTFPPVHLLTGHTNPITFFYLKKGDVLDINKTENVTKTIYIVRKAGAPTPQEQVIFDQSFHIQCGTGIWSSSAKNPIRQFGISALSITKSGVKLQIHMPTAEPYALSLFNASGARLWAHTSSNGFATDTQVIVPGSVGMQSGLYIAVLRQTGMKFVKSFVMTR